MLGCMKLVMSHLSENKIFKSVFMKSMFVGPLNMKEILFSQRSTSKFKHKSLGIYRHTSPGQYVSKCGSLVDHEINLAGP